MDGSPRPIHFRMSKRMNYSLRGLATLLLSGCFGCVWLTFAQAAPLPTHSATTSSTNVSSTTAQAPQSDVQGTYERASVEKVEQTSEQVPGGGQQVDVYTVRFLSGPWNGQTKTISNEVGSDPYGIQPVVGDSLVIFIQPDGSGGSNFYIESYDRHTAMLWLAILFVLTLVLLAGWQGIKVAFSILISLVLIGWVLIPAFLSGVNPVPVAIAISGVLALLSAGLSTGWNRKSLVTAIGTMGGILVAYMISDWFSTWSHLDGLSSDEDRLFFSNNQNLNPRGLLFAGIIIASLGVVEDVAVSIASGVSEVKRANPRATTRELFASGMVVGKDHMAALANTLVYAYVGGSLSTLLLYKQFGASWFKFINFDIVVDEIIRSLSGTIGLIFTVPITALLSAWVIARTRTDVLNALPMDTHHHAHDHGDAVHTPSEVTSVPKIHRTPK